MTEDKVIHQIEEYAKYINRFFEENSVKKFPSNKYFEMLIYFRIIRDLDIRHDVTEYSKYLIEFLESKMFQKYIRNLKLEKIKEKV